MRRLAEVETACVDIGAARQDNIIGARGHRHDRQVQFDIRGRASLSPWLMLGLLRMPTQSAGAVDPAIWLEKRETATCPA